VCWHECPLRGVLQDYRGSGVALIGVGVIVEDMIGGSGGVRRSRRRSIRRLGL
jgi:hypothetical protein